MSIVVMGINHRSAPLDVIERVSISDAALPKALHGLASRDNVRETVVLSTCNRTEVYVVAEKFHGAYGDVRDFFCEISGLSADELHPHFYSQHDDAAVAHLFEVACGLDSVVIGESEILGQVKVAWEKARDQTTAHATLNMLFRYAVEVGKRARTETAIGSSTASISHAAVEMARELLGSLSGRRMLVVGAGEMGTGVARALAGAGATDVVVLNRNTERAAKLAQRVGAIVGDFDDLATALGLADVVLTCTGSGDTIITEHMVKTAHNTGRPLLIVDIAMPRDVEHSVGGLTGVTLRDLHDLRDWAQTGIEARKLEVQQVREIVSYEVERFGQDFVARQAAPLIAELHERVEKLRQVEIDRFSSRLSDLSPAQREHVEVLTKAIVAKLLHSPSTQLKNSAGTPQGERISAALRDLFDIA